MKYSLAEFFCGCGGFSRGFVNSKRFNAVLGNDIKKAALRTFAFNHRSDEINPATIEQDIRTVPLAQLRESLNSRGVSHGELDCLIGGPPCQGFSQLRRSEEREGGKIIKFRGYSKLAHDPRNDLVLRFLEIAEYLRPKIIVIENVPQMLLHGFNGRLGNIAETVIEMLEKEMGYSVLVATVSAADYGVPQLRSRAVIIASAVGQASLPDATHAAPDDRGAIARGKSPWRTVRDAIADLPPPSMGNEILGGRETKQYLDTDSDYASLLRSTARFPYNHITRSYSDSVLRIIQAMKQGEEWDAAMTRMQRRYAIQLTKFVDKHGGSQGVARRKLIKDGIINPVFYRKYYWSAYTRLEWGSPALTITANANFLGSGRFTHPEELRGITMREAARLQSFDDDFTFVTAEGEEPDTSKIGIGMDMIGEAVPPLLAQAIALAIAKQLDGKRTNRSDQRIQGQEESNDEFDGNRGLRYRA
jgi:DNA (cytosine-5)-methyltransferase 1